MPFEVETLERLKSQRAAREYSQEGERLMDRPGTLFYIVTASGPYVKKAYKQRIFTSFVEASRVANEATTKLYPEQYSVHAMIATPI